MSVQAPVTRARPQWELKAIYGGMVQFMVIQVIALQAIIMFPQIALWFPNCLFGP